MIPTDGPANVPGTDAARQLIADARALARDGSWEALRASLAGHQELVAAHPQLGMLAAEADLWLGNPEGARRCLLSAIPILERAGDGPSLRRAVNMLGAAHFEMGQLREAEMAFERALELASMEDDALLVARATNNLGAIANIRGRRESALALYQLAVPAYQRIGHTLGLAQSLHNMAITFRDLRQLEQADECERRAGEYASEAGDPRLVAMTRAGRAELSLLRGDPRLAEAGARRAAIEYALIPDPAGEADALRLAGTARASSGDPQAALALLTRALEIAREHGSALIEAEALDERSEVLLAAGLRDAARADAAAARDLYFRLGAEAERARMDERLGRM